MLPPTIIVLVVCGMVVVHCAPQAPAPSPIPIVSQNSNLNPDGSYTYNFQTGNEINVEEEGTIKKAANPASPEEENVIAVKGKYSYKLDDGTLIELTYSADDETGFVPQGAHLPTSPPIPEAIQKALDYIAAHPEQNEPPAKG